MSAFVGVNGVCREVSGIEVGKRGTNHVLGGYCGVNGIARPFLDIVNQIQQIEFRVERLISATIDSDYSFSNQEDIAKSECSSYGSYSTNRSTLSVTSANTGKGLLVCAADYAVFRDGCETKDFLSILNELQKDISISLDGYLSGDYYGSSRFDGAYTLFYFDEALYSGSFDGSVRFSRTYGNSVITSRKYPFFLGAGEVSGNGYQTTRVTVDSLTVDGVSIPCEFVDDL